jgi:hypothetical protein
MYFMKNLNLLGGFPPERRRTKAPHYKPDESVKHMVEKLG